MLFCVYRRMGSRQGGKHACISLGRSVYEKQRYHAYCIDQRTPPSSTSPIIITIPLHVLNALASTSPLWHEYTPTLSKAMQTSMWWNFCTTISQCCCGMQWWGWYYNICLQWLDASNTDFANPARPILRTQNSTPIYAWFQITNGVLCIDVEIKSGNSCFRYT